MPQFFDKITHGQWRIILLSIGMVFVLAGAGMIIVTHPDYDGWMFHTGGILLTVGVVVVALELTGLRRVLRMAFGFAVLAFGLFLSIPAVPGPGFVFVLLGLAVLAADFQWARNLLHRLNTAYHKAVDKVKSAREAKKAEKREP